MITEENIASAAEAGAPPGDAPGPGRAVQSAGRLEELIQQTEQLRDPVARALVQECLHSLLTFYGEGLARMLQIARERGPGAEELLNQFAQDTVVRGLLMVHGLHPFPLEARLNQALDKVRPYLESHGGNVELLGLEENVAKLRLQGACHTCPSSAVTLEMAVRRAIEEACPDLAGFEVV